jgi:hypothetical protein
LDIVDDLKTGTVADMKDVDLSSSDTSFVNALTLLGDQTRFSSRYSSNFPCYSNIHPDAVDFSKVSREIRDQNGASVSTYSASGGALNVRSEPGLNGQPYLHVWINDKYAKSYVKKMNASNVESGTYEIKFKTKKDVDPRTGKSI